jgi:hypothetical protein
MTMVMLQLVAFAQQRFLSPISVFLSPIIDLEIRLRQPTLIFYPVEQPVFL